MRCARSAGSERGVTPVLSDITLGQFFPGKSPVHKLDARVKLILTIAYIVALFMVSNYFGYLVIVGLIGLVLALSKIPFSMLLKSLKPLIFIIAFTAVLNLFYGAGEHVLFEYGFLRITEEGIRNAIMMSLRIIFLIAGTSLLTYTTSPIMLTDAIERLLSPLKKIHLPVHELAMMMTIALRFIPTLVEETGKIMSAQKARGADFESGSLVSRVKALVPILVPLFVSAFRRADELATAMECRCYHGGENRTRMKQLTIAGRDFAACGVFALCIALIVLCNIYL